MQKTISHHFILHPTTANQVIHEKYPLPIQNVTLLRYRAQAKLSTLNPAGENRYWIHASTSLEGQYRYGGPQGHALIVFDNEDPLVPADRVITVQTRVQVPQLEIEFDVQAVNTTDIEIVLELEIVDNKS